jgi:hypothetical protein
MILRVEPVMTSSPLLSIYTFLTIREWLNEFLNLGMNIMPLESIPNSYLLSSEISNTNVMDARPCKVKG